MRASVFEEIIRKVDHGERAELEVAVSGKRLIRAFVPDDRLILLGGGHVSLALAHMAERLGFAITVVDDRMSFANTERFPMARQVICDSFAHAIPALAIRGSDYVCVLTRGHQWDTVCVRAILSGRVMPYYFGMIGSRRRVAGMREGLFAEGCDPARLEQLHAPIGLPIGGVTPDEIAVSICAEMIQCRYRDKILPRQEMLSQQNVDSEMLRCAAAGGEPRAMLLVTASAGSTPVKSGAMMVVNVLGKSYGTIGGGCSENEAIIAARRVIGTGGSRLLEIDMTDEVAAENGMVCGGTMQVLIEDITE